MDRRQSALRHIDMIRRGMLVVKQFDLNILQRQR